MGERGARCIGLAPHNLEDDHNAFYKERVADPEVGGCGEGEFGPPEASNFGVERQEEVVEQDSWADVEDLRRRMKAKRWRTG